MFNILNELKRRNIYRVAAVYAVVGWIIVQIAVALEDAVSLPSWFDGLVVALLIVIFPVALLLTWAFEMTPEGIKRTECASSEELHQHRHKLTDALLIIGTLIVMALVAVEAVYLDTSSPSKTLPLVSSSSAVDSNNVTSNSANPTEQMTSSANIRMASIAVLPFSDLSPNNDQEYFSDGISEEILNVLVRIDGLSVASRTSSFQFKNNSSIGIPAIAQKLSVRHILEGSVRKAGDSIRITAQLIDAQSDAHLWSETFDRVLSTDSIFSIQDEIANAIVIKLSELMDIAPKATLIEILPTTSSLDAYELYLKGQQLFAQRKHMTQSIEYLEGAVQIDPEFAQAWATLSVVYAVVDDYSRRSNSENWTELGKAAALKAIQLNPKLSLSYAALSRIAYKQNTPDFEQAFMQINRALEREPLSTTALLWRGTYFNAVGDFPNAELDFKACLKIDPAYWNCQPHLNRSYLYQNKVSEALQGVKELILQGHDEFTLDTYYTYALAKEYDTLLAYIVAYERDNEPASSRQLFYRMYTDADFDFQQNKSQLFSVFETENFKLNQSSAMYQSTYAFWFRDYEHVMLSGSFNYYWLSYPNAWQSSPHRKRLIAESGLPAYWRKNGFPEQCKAKGINDFWCVGFAN